MCECIGRCYEPDTHLIIPQQVKTLAQITICLDKRTLAPIDCNPIKGGLNQFCPRKDRAIVYPGAARQEGLFS